MKRSEEHTEQPQPTSIADLRPKMQLEGVVRRTELYGAFVDVGLERDGLVHISRLSNRHVDRVSDIVKEGDQVTVWVIHVDPDQGRIALAMIKPPDVEWKNLKEGQTYTGHIVRIERYGVFVDIGAERPGLLHVREMKGRVFHHPSELFQEGDEVDTRILNLDRRKRRIDLAMEDLPDVTIEEDESEDLPTAVELAFRRAREESQEQAQQRETPTGEERRSVQDEILSRTLQQHTSEESP